MALRFRPATTLCVLLAVALAFQIIAVISVPVTQSITLCTYDGVKFGVFGLCSDGSCTKAQIGYSTDDIEDLSGFSLPSNARHSISKLLIVHPIAAGFTAILFFGAILLHWHGPSSSMKFLFAIQLWCLPCFLLTLLSFLVDILLFVPHLDWAGWIVFASTVLIAIAAIMLCIMRRTVSSRKAVRMSNVAGAGLDYQLAPLNYGYGTVDGGSEYKFDIHSREEDTDERAPFVHDDSVQNFDDSTRYDYDGDIHQTSAYDSVRGSGVGSNTYRSSDILTAPSTAYRGGYEHSPSQSEPIAESLSDAPGYDIPETNPVPTPQVFIPQANDFTTSPEMENVENVPLSPPQTAPYPSDIHMAIIGDLPEVNESPTAPYPQDLLPRSTKVTGPRPMPSPQRSTSGASEILSAPNITEGDTWGFAFDQDEPTAPPLPAGAAKDSVAPNPDIERAPTYRTRIAQNLAALQPTTYSTESFAETDEDLLAATSEPVRREIGEIFTDGENTTLDRTEDELEYSDSNDDKAPVVYQSHPEQTLALANADDASSTYSSRVPSTINTPVEAQFPRRVPSVLQKSRIPENGVLASNFIQTIGDHEINTPSDVTLDDFPFPDPNERRTTPAPSFSNESIGSSTFTSVSQRGINPRYFEKNPEEYAAYVQRQNMGMRGANTQRGTHGVQGTSDLLISSNPDFSIGNVKAKRAGRR